ncbi:hypothetical protein QR46_4871 [Giardia duodenalis assemblage B]|uniref:Uncharacterized protein n=1 Tax=Giardia duodenalis assemblage B TaxID=1394984 RepID=A0A132NM67_GIAIN|nr:hypothetical protein QR46_4871 [Giardia intestinalis assemblage B]
MRPRPDRSLTPWHREPGQPRIGVPPSAAHTALLRDRCTSRGAVNQGWGGAQQLPRARRPVCLALSGRELPALAGAPGHGSPDRGDRGAHGWGTVVC